MTIIFPLLATLLIATRCDGFGSLSPSITRTTPRNNVHLTFTRASHRGQQILRSSSSSSFKKSRQISRRYSRLFSAASLPLEDETNDDSGSSSSNNNNKSANRPDWALPWMPTWLITLRPITQLIVGLGLYIFHLRILTQYGITFPVQLIPNDEGWFQSIGLDSLAGMFSLFGMIWLRKSSMKHAAKGNDFKVVVPSVWADPTDEEAPWKLRL